MTLSYERIPPLHAHIFALDSHTIIIHAILLQDRLFGGRVRTFRQEWAAYPVLTPYPFSEWPRIKLHGMGAVSPSCLLDFLSVVAAVRHRWSFAPDSAGLGFWGGAQISCTTPTRSRAQYRAWRRRSPRLATSPTSSCATSPGENAVRHTISFEFLFGFENSNFFVEFEFWFLRLDQRFCWISD
jgi:hypothetical protein